MQAFHVTSGICHAVFAYDLGFAIHLDRAESIIAALNASEMHRGTLRHERRGPRDVEYGPLPLRVSRDTTPIRIAGFESAPRVEAVLHDFGVVAITYAIPISGPAEKLLELSLALYENPALLADSRRLAAELLESFRAAIDRPLLAEQVEDYLVFHFAETEGADTTDDILTRHRALLARILRAEAEPLSPQEVDDAMSVRVSYGLRDAAVIDWNGALLLGPADDDTLAVLRFANVELLELRFLDSQLDRSLTPAFEAAQRRPRPWDMFSRRTAADMRRIATFQVESASLFEGVNNSLKLLGDQYLARLYRRAAERLHLAEWDASILRKLGTLETIHDKLSDRQTARRAEFLELIIVLLILFEVVMSFVRAR